MRVLFSPDRVVPTHPSSPAAPTHVISRAERSQGKERGKGGARPRGIYHRRARLRRNYSSWAANSLQGWHRQVLSQPRGWRRGCCYRRGQHGLWLPWLRQRHTGKGQREGVVRTARLRTAAAAQPVKDDGWGRVVSRRA